MNNRAKKLIFLVVVVAVFKNFAVPYSTVGECYGFKTKAQQEAFAFLLKKSSSNYDDKKGEMSIVHDLIMMVKQTQISFFNRSSGAKERWEIDPLQWMKEDEEQNFKSLQLLGFVDAVDVEQDSCDALCILGGLGPTMQHRVDYSGTLVESGLSTNMVILVTGERSVTQDIDGSQKELEQFAKDAGVYDWRMLQESDIMRSIYNRSILAKKGVDTIVLDTSKGDASRATTQTTIVTLANWLKEHEEVQRIVFISSQPALLYQKAIIDCIFKEQEVAVQYEVVGPAIHSCYNIEQIVTGLGSYLWAALPTILLTIHAKITDSVSRETLKELYEKNPLLFARVQRCFKET